MKKVFILYFSLLILIVSSCRQMNAKTFEYASLSFDTTNTVFFKWDSALYTFTNYSEPLAINNDDIKLADSLLRDAIDTFNNTVGKAAYREFNQQVPIDSFIIDLPKYKRQFYPYKDVNGQKIIHVVCFSTTFNEWKSKPYSGPYRGINYFTLRINLSDKKADQLSTGSYG